MAEEMQYELYYAPAENGQPSADASSWKLLAQGSRKYAGYYTVPAELPEAVPEGTGAIILKLTAAHPSIGTDESLLQLSRPLFNAKADNGSSFFLKDGAFIPAGHEVQADDRSYMQYSDVCLRAYTEPAE